MTDLLHHGGGEFLGAFAGAGKAQALRWPASAEGALHFASRGDIQGVDMGAQTLQQAYIRIGLNGIADLEAQRAAIFSIK